MEIETNCAELRVTLVTEYRVIKLTRNKALQFSRSDKKVENKLPQEKQKKQKATTAPMQPSPC
jgi:hypothetical protein